MNKIVLLTLAVSAIAFAVADAQTSRYNLGRPASLEELKNRNISVAPDGTGLPPGHGTVEQGRKIYKVRCANCHGDQGQGIGEYPALTGGEGTLTGKDPKITVGSYWPFATTVWDYIRRAMPYQRPGSLTVDETYAVTAFLLHLNGIVDEKKELTEKTLPQVKMANRNGFVPDPRPDEKLLLKKDITSYAGSDMVLTVRELEIPPAYLGTKHRHPGPVVVCVLEGSLEIALEGQAPQTYDRGQCFSEEPHQLHISSRNPSKTQPARIISYILSRSGEPLSQPEK